jgi:phosphoglycerate dehydrogenase-like enzyme
MGSDNPLRIVFAEEDTLFRLMESAVIRQLTPSCERALTYFFGPDFSSPLQALTSMADRLGIPSDMEAVICSSKDSLDEAVSSADFLVVEREPISRALIRAGAQRIRLIQKFGRDCRNIDLAAAKEYGVKVANVVRYSSLSSADNIMALLLALARNLIKAHQSVLAQRDSSLKSEFEKGPVRTKFNWTSIRNIRVLAENTLGFIGLGENSGEVAKRARTFGMRLVYYKRRRLPVEEETALAVEYLALDELLAQADFVSIHVPYGPETDKMIGSNELARMKAGAYLINTARGGVVDEEALHNALRNKQIAGAALDVYRYEPVPPNCPLLDLDNIVWTPHMSGGEAGFMLRDTEDVLANIARILRGDAPLGLVSC